MPEAGVEPAPVPYVRIPLRTPADSNRGGELPRCLPFHHSGISGISAAVFTSYLDTGHLSNRCTVMGSHPYPVCGSL